MYPQTDFVVDNIIEFFFKNASLNLQIEEKITKNIGLTYNLIRLQI